MTPYARLSFAANLALLAVQVAQAQEARSEELVLEEIIVTAERRADNLQETPIAVTAFVGKDLEDKGIDDISQIADFTPNLVFDTTAIISGASNASVIFLRGVGQSNFQVTNDPGVGTYVDGVYMSSAIGGVLDVIDIERIEVLRGPQGTLFGRNTIGGAINITTTPPSPDGGGSVQFRVGNLNRTDVRASMDIPFGDRFLSRWTASYKRADGYVKVTAPFGSSTGSTGNYSDGLERSLDDLGDDNEGAVRVSILFTPSDSLAIAIATDMSRIREASAASTLAGVQGPGPNNLGLVTFLYNTFDAPNIDIPSLGKNIPYDERWVSRNPESETFKTGPNGTDIDGFGVAGTLTWDARENLTFKSITSFRDTEAAFNRDADGSPLQFTHTSNDFRHEQFSQELQLLGDSFQGSLEWIAGVYYFSEEATDDLRAPLAPSVGTVNINADIENRSIAVFGQASWHLTERFDVTFGLRRTEDRRELLPDFFYEREAGGAFAGARNVPLQLVKDTFEQTTPRLSFNYQVGGKSLLYLSYSEGYKSGGFNSRTTAPRTEVLAFLPEELETIELGYKWQGFSDRVRINSAAFYSDYTDVQVTVIEDIAPGTQNGGEVEIKGLELELTALLTPALRLGVGLGWIDAEYKSLVPLTPGVPPVSQIKITDKLVNTPEMSATVGVEYSIQVGRADLVLRFDWSYSDEVYNDDINSEILKAPEHSIYNAQVSYETVAWQIVLWGENLSDERVIVGGDANFIIGFLEANYNPPRTYGLTMRRFF